jgi:hypothetical protein
MTSIVVNLPDAEILTHNLSESLSDILEGKTLILKKLEGGMAPARSLQEPVWYVWSPPPEEAPAEQAPAEVVDNAETTPTDSVVAEVKVPPKKAQNPWEGLEGHERFSLEGLVQRLASKLKKPRSIMRVAVYVPISGISGIYTCYEITACKPAKKA